MKSLFLVISHTLLVATYLYAQPYDKLAFKGYGLYAEGVANKDTNCLKQAGGLLQKAANQKKSSGAIKETLLWDAAMIYGMAQDTANTFKALEMCLGAGLTDVDKVSTRPVFTYLKSEPKWERLIARFRNAERRYVLQLKNQRLRAELLQMWAEDQRLRFLLREKVRELKENWSAPELGQLYSEIRRTDSIHYERMQQVIAQSGWPKLSEVGNDGSFAAWALAQHSNIVAFQERCIKAMEPLLTLKEVNPIDYAHLVDRVMFNQKQKQVYGQAEPGYPIENEVELNDRRKKIGLIPMQEYAHLNGFEYKPGKEKEK
jgi:hypothetical protein